MSYTRHDQMLEACREFHREHPEVWALFVKFTFQLIDRGFKHYSARGVFARIRFETDVPDVEGRTTWKINNNHSPFYARRFMRMYPEHDGFFRVRAQTSKDTRPSPYPELGPDYFDARPA